jgi:hypothetical protein
MLTLSPQSKSVNHSDDEQDLPPITSITSLTSDNNADHNDEYNLLDDQFDLDGNPIVPLPIELTTEPIWHALPSYLHFNMNLITYIMIGIILLLSIGAFVLDVIDVVQGESDGS